LLIVFLQLSLDFYRHRAQSEQLDVFRLQGKEGCGENLKLWVLEGSINGQTRFELDRPEDSDELNRTRIMRTFEVVRTEEYRMIRLVNIGVNHFGNDQMVIFAWDFFGLLRP
jgi:hypothetical protein